MTCRMDMHVQPTAHTICNSQLLTHIQAMVQSGSSIRAGRLAVSWENLAGMSLFIHQPVEL